MIQVSFKASFVKQFNKLDHVLAEEIIEKIALFKNLDNHTKLKVHKLHGKLKTIWSFSVNYKIRIVFIYESKNEVVFLAIGDHDVYK